MAVTIHWVELTNDRTQGNLKGEILDEKLAILKSIQDSERGPQKGGPVRINNGKIVSSTVGYV